MVKGSKRYRRLEKYEQKNRTPDGEILFKSRADLRSHGAEKNLSKVIVIMGFFTGVSGMIFIGYGLYYTFILSA